MPFRFLVSKVHRLFLTPLLGGQVRCWKYYYASPSVYHRIDLGYIPSIFCRFPQALLRFLLFLVVFEMLALLKVLISFSFLWIEGVVLHMHFLGFSTLPTMNILLLFKAYVRVYLVILLVFLASLFSCNIIHSFLNTFFLNILSFQRYYGYCFYDSPLVYNILIFVFVPNAFVKFVFQHLTLSCIVGRRYHMSYSCFCL